MAFLIDLVGLLLVPGAVFSVAAGFGSVTLLRFLRDLLNRKGDTQPAPGMLESLDLLQLAGLDLWRRGGRNLLFVSLGVAAAGAASTLVWRAIPGVGGARGDTFALAVLLVAPALVLFLMLSFRTGGSEAGLGRFAVVFAYAALFSVAMGIVTVRTGAFNLLQIAQAQVSNGPWALTPSGGIGFVVALIAAALMLSATELAAVAPEGPADLSFPLAHGLIRAAWLYAVVASLALLFWSGLARGPVALLVFFGTYLVLLLALGGLLIGIGRAEPARVVGNAWLPLALAAALALALAAGGY